MLTLDFPEKLVRYRSFNEKSVKELIDGQVWLTSPTAFNDPFDCTLDYKNTYDFARTSAFNYKFYKKFYDQSDLHKKAAFLIGLNDESAQESFRVELQRVFHDTAKKFGFLCFSTSEKIGLMWSHYAEGHKGFCVEYDVGELKNAVLSSREMFLGKVEYEPVAYLTYEEFEKSLLDKEEFDAVDKDPLHRKAFLTKDKNWEYESEWRLIKLASANSFFRLPCRIRKIYLGLRMEQPEQSRLIHLLEGRGIQFCSMKRELHTFNVISA